ncbi:MAG: hypothetical protein HQK89_06210 [Nitrospirae bacterium]|nr:hypothetical protein [Nitrospirota bacterium]
MRSLFILLFLLFFISTVPAAAGSSFTQSDRDRMIRLETRVEDGFKATNQRIDDMMADMNRRFEQVDKRFDQVDKHFDQVTTFMFWCFGILFGGMGLLITLVIWDRRTAIAPAVHKTKEIGERTELVEKALREVALKNPDVKEALKHFGLMQ